MDDAPGVEGLVELPGGRRLAYAETGDSSGAPCLFFHGIPGSRRQAVVIGRQAAAVGLRVIGIDRPGFGGSTFQPGRRFLDWPADVTAVVDALGLSRFAVVGISGGAAYALACARALRERLTAVAVVSGMGPLDDPVMGPAFQYLPKRVRLGVPLARRAPGIALRVLIRQHEREGRLPNPIARYAAMMSPADRRLLARAEVAAGLLDDRDEALRQGPAGVAWDLVLYARPWGFRLDEVRVPVLLWHGEDDWIVPIAFARGVARALPRCRADFWPGDGHLAAISHSTEIARALSSAVLA